MSFLPDQTEQHPMVHRIKELPNVAFQGIRRAMKVPAYLPQEMLQPGYTTVGASVYSAGVGIKDEAGIVHRIQHPKDRLVNHAVFYAGFMDVP